MAVKDAATASKRWREKTAAATTDYADGVRRVTQAPGVAAAAQQSKMLTNVTKAIQSGHWAKQVSKVPLQEWQDKAINKGAGRIAAGVEAAADKQAQVMEKIITNVVAVKQEIDRMPSTTLDERINRMVAFSRGMAARPVK